MEFDQLKSQWNAVLDDLLNTDRIAWLAYFDARLVSLDGVRLHLNFADSEKFGGDHDYKSIRKPEHTAKLISSIKKVTGENLEVVE